MKTQMMYIATLVTLVGLFALAVCQEGTERADNTTRKPNVPLKCPKRANVYICSCQVQKRGLGVFCEFTDEQHVKRAISALNETSSYILNLKLRHNDLQELPNYLFYGLTIRHLTIHDSNVSVIEEDSLTSLGNDLTLLDLSQNLLTSIPSAAYRELQYVRNLNMNGNNINSIQSLAFEGMDRLEMLTLSKNKISIIHAEAFAGLGKPLQILDLSGNMLYSVPRKALAVLKHLKKLQLQDNFIWKIQEGDFEGMKNLDTLALARNNLKELPARAFSNLTQLNTLDLNGNSILEIDPSAFMDIGESLQNLRLGDNNIQAIPTPALRALHALVHLDLKGNHISQISAGAFAEYGWSISFLNLESNEITNVSAFGLDNLTSLEVLNLRNNKITHLSEAVMAPVLSTLQEVDLAKNPLVCNCGFQWYENWLKYLEKYDFNTEIMLTKTTACVLPQDRRVYKLQHIPVNRMACEVHSPDSATLFTASPVALCLFTFTIKFAF